MLALLGHAFEFHSRSLSSWLPWLCPAEILINVQLWLFKLIRYILIQIDFANLDLNQQQMRSDTGLYVSSPISQTSTTYTIWDWLKIWPPYPQFLSTTYIILAISFFQIQSFKVISTLIYITFITRDTLILSTPSVFFYLITNYFAYFLDRIRFSSWFN